MAYRRWWRWWPPVFLWMAAAAAHAGVAHDSGLDWFTLDSEHFRIHYHEGLEPAARRALVLAEAARARLAPRLGGAPRRRVEMVLTDEVRQANGFAQVFPDHRLTLYLTPPDDIAGLEDHAGWLELLVTHEVFHVLHLDRARGTPAALRRVFGRFPWLFPNALQPRWITEGLATWAETDAARGIGRGQSSYFDMLMRLELAGGLKPLRQVNQPLATWPGGTTHYLYGVGFMQFIAERYGEAALWRLVEHYSDNLIPFRINSNAAGVLGRELPQLWAEYGRWLEARHGGVLRGVRSRGGRAGTRLTHDGYDAGPLAPVPGGGVAYVGWDRRDWPVLWRLHPDGRRERLARVLPGARVAGGGPGLLVVQPEVCRNAGLRHDLYRLEAGGLRRLTRCGGYPFAAWLPDGGILAVRRERGQSALVRLEADGSGERVLWAGNDGTVLSHLDVSPDGRLAAVAVWRPGGGWNLEAWDLVRGGWQPLTRDAAIENHPRFTNGGRALLFTADYGGVYNIRRLDLASGRLETLTDVAGGAFHPVLAEEEGVLYYAGAHPGGRDVYALSLARAGGAPVQVPAGPSGRPAPVPPAAAVGPPRDYAPWSSLVPRWWFPTLVVDGDRTEAGFVTSGYDALARHVYALDLAWEAEQGELVGGIDYYYDRLPVLLKAGFRRSLRFVRGADGGLAGGVFDDELELAAAWPWLRVEDRWVLHAGVVRNVTRTAFTSSSFSGARLEDTLAGVAVEYTGTRRFPRGISRLGREVLVVAEDSDALGDSFYRGRVYTLDWREFVHLGRGHVLAARLTGGWGTDAPRRFVLGGQGDVHFQPPLLAGPAGGSPFNRRAYALRGYPQGLVGLTGRRMTLAGLEYRFPLALVERGFMAPPVGLDRVHGALFLEAGAAWELGNSPRDYFRSAGLELSAETVLFYDLPLRLTAGVARGLDPGGEDQVYLRLTASF